jgi:hypothetical protein
MKAKRYFQCSFFLPLIVPLLAGLILLLTRGFDSVAGESRFQFPLVILVFSLWVGGIPYLIFLVAALIWSERHSVWEIQLFTFVAPLIYTLLLGVFVVAPYGITLSLQDPTWLVILGYGIAVGYFYVLPVNVLYCLLKLVRLVRMEEDASQPAFITIGLQDKQVD